LILTKIEQDLADTKTFYLLSRYDTVETDALQLSAEDVETGANVQLPASACLRVEEQLLPPHFVLSQLMFWYHQPARKSDVLCLHGAGELPCPTNILRCCCTGAGASLEELHRNQELLLGTAVQQPTRRLRLHQFATNLSEAFLGCTALGNTIQQLQASSITGIKNCASVRPDVAQPPLSSASAAGSSEREATWFEADQIIAERQVPCAKGKRNATMYLVRWRGHPPPPDSWEPRANLSPELFNQWINELRPSDGAGVSCLSPERESTSEPMSYPMHMSPFRSQDLGWSIMLPLYGSALGHIYGSDIYTDDSDVATAAMHAGVLQKDESRVVKVFITGPRRSFSKSLRNGIQSHKFHYFAGSFTFDEDIALGLRNSAKKRRVGQLDTLPSASAAASTKKMGSKIESEAIDNVAVFQASDDDDILVYEWGP
jgi:hypothetical protein